MVTKRRGEQKRGDEGEDRGGLTVVMMKMMMERTGEKTCGERIIV